MAPVTGSVNSLFFRCLLAVVVLAPLPLACNRPWSWSLLALLVGGLLTAWGGAALAGRARVPMSLERLRLVMIPFALALAWAWLQSRPWLPPAWTHPIWSESATTLGGDVAATISIAPDRTMTALMRLACYGGVFLLAAQLGRDRARAHEGLVV